MGSNNPGQETRPSNNVRRSTLIRNSRGTARLRTRQNPPRAPPRPPGRLEAAPDLFTSTHWALQSGSDERGIPELTDGEAIALFQTMQPDFKVIEAQVERILDDPGFAADTDNLLQLRDASNAFLPVMH